MDAVLGVSLLDVNQRPISFFGWGLVFGVGIVLWALIFYLT